MKYLFTLIIALGCLISLQAQEASEVEETGDTADASVSENNGTMSLGEQPAFIIEHPDAGRKMTSKIVTKSLKDYGKVKRNKKAKEWSCLQCKVPGISSPTDVYVKFQEGKALTTTYLFYDDGTKFISSDNDPEAAIAIQKELTYIGYDVTRGVISKELDMEEDRLKDRNKEQEKLEKEKKKLLENIEKWTQQIADAEKRIEENLGEQETKKGEIEEQAKVVDVVKERLNRVGKG